MIFIDIPDCLLYYNFIKIIESSSGQGDFYKNSLPAVKSATRFGKGKVADMVQFHNRQ